MNHNHNQPKDRWNSNPMEFPIQGIRICASNRCFERSLNLIQHANSSALQRDLKMFGKTSSSLHCDDFIR